MADSKLTRQVNANDTGPAASLALSNEIEDLEAEIYDIKCYYAEVIGKPPDYFADLLTPLEIRARKELFESLGYSPPPEVIEGPPDPEKIALWNEAAKKVQEEEEDKHKNLQGIGLDPNSQEYQELLPMAKYLVPARKLYPPPRHLLNFKNVGFMPLGNISQVAAPAKFGKTFAISNFMAAMFNDDVSQCLGIIQTRLCRDMGPKVLYIDTEQELCDTSCIEARVHYLCGWPTHEDTPNFAVINVSDESPEERVKVCEAYIKAYKPLAVFIDGLRDLLHDFNNIDESMALVEKIRSWAKRYNCHICQVQHLPPSAADKQEPRGHLGTESTNKVSDSFILSKSDSVFTITNNKSRHRSIDEISFTIETVMLEDRREIGIPVYYYKGQPVKDAADNSTEEKSRKDELRELLEPFFGNSPDMRRSGDVVAHIMREASVKERQAKNILKEACGFYVIENCEDYPGGYGKYRYLPQGSATPQQEQRLPMDEAAPHEDGESTNGLPFEPPKEDEPLAF